MLLRLLVFLSTGWISGVNGNQYIYVNLSKTWMESREYCKQKGFELSTLDGQGIEICNLTDVTELWTNKFIYTTPYLSLSGCYKMTDSMEFFPLQTASVVECQMQCRDSPRFAIQNNSCSCIKPDSDQSALQNAEQCSYTCEGQVICGGDNVTSIYEQANISHLLSEQPLIPPNNSRCLFYQCVNGTVDFKEKDCQNQDFANDNNYFSCSFEPESDCFLWQTKGNLEWSIQNSPPQNSLELDYIASYYAYVNGSGTSSGQKAVLISRMKFKASSWCLRFRYYTDKTVSMDVITWDLIADKKNSFVKIRNQTSTRNTRAAWYLVERNINMTGDFKLMFKFETVGNETDISIDDVTMIADVCNTTLSTLLSKEREIQCTFGGDFDVCFRQDESNDGIYWSLTNNQRWLSFGNVGQESVLISKFELFDINMTMSIKYISKNKLELYWKDEQGNEINTIRMNDTGGRTDTISTTIYVNARSYLYVRGTIRERNQPLDLYFIKINVNNKSNTKVERINGSSQIPDPYAITLSDVTNNLQCIHNGEIKMSNTIKLLGNLLPKNGKPSAVQIYKENKSNWETFDSTTMRTFVCEQDSGPNKRCEVLADFILHVLRGEDLQETNVTLIAAILACLLVFITICIASIIVYKRNQLFKNNRKTNDHSMGEPNSIKLSYEKVEGTKQDIVEEDYDHLHQNQTIVQASSEDMYSHMADNQYGLLPVVVDDTYDHSVGREGEYGSTQVCQEPENTYDHT